MTIQQRITGTAYPLKLKAFEFLALVDAGLIEERPHIELIEGEVWTMNAVYRWHARAQAQFTVAIMQALAAAGLDLVVYSAGSVLLSDDSVPEPDISVAVAEPLTRAPISLDALKLAIELTDATRVMDLERKPRLYALAGIPEYWVADRDEQQLVRHAQPTAEGYLKVDRIPFGQSVASATLPGVVVETLSLKD